MATWASRPASGMPLSISWAGMGAAWTVRQHAQAYLPRRWRRTKNWAGTPSSCSLTSSPMRLKRLATGAVRGTQVAVAIDERQADGQRLTHGLALDARSGGRRLGRVLGGCVFDARCRPGWR